MIKDLRNLEQDVRHTIDSVDEFIRDMCKEDTFILNKTNHIFLLGKGVDECISREGSLKIKEVSYIHSESYSASALKHGPFALLDEDFPVFIFNLQEEHRAKVLNCYEEIRSRYSPIFFITNDDSFDADIDKKNSTDGNRTIVIRVAKNNSYGSLLGILPVQLMAYYLSVYRGINPDIPKNLAKVVTVE
jgi:glucosamine--fructose-6-phosphate aminotransferase (isomerizing)